jgi:glycosyltransferase involved in cell wall biosynthesis
MKISIIIPAYQGSNTIRDLFNGINETLSGKYDFEVLFVFDNGTKITWETIKQLRIENPQTVKAFHLEKNYGQHRALKYGFEMASGDLVVTIDEDLQHDPADILILLEKQIEGNYDIVYGRFAELHINGIRKKISLLLRKALKRFIPQLYDYYSPYRLIKKDVVAKSVKMFSPYVFIDDFLCRITQNISYVDINHHPRTSGKSSYTLAKLLKHGILILLAYSRLVLILVSIAGIFIGSGILLYVSTYLKTGNWIHTPFIEKYELLINIIGLVFLGFGLMGEFINRHNLNKNESPVLVKKESSI